jgi:hypothetical protein
LSPSRVHFHVSPVDAGGDETQSRHK